MRARASFLFLVFLAGCATADLRPSRDELGEFVSREDYLQLLEPRGNRILHGSGANPEDFADYWNELVRTPPMLYAIHFDLLSLPEDWSYLVQEVVNRYPGYVIPQIALSLTYEGRPYEDRVARGDLDPQIEILCQGLAWLGRAAFVRPGYGFNSAWTRYRPESYRKAWERIVESIRIRHRLQNIAMVWCYAADSGASDFMAYYPGDAYVDWWGVDLFDPSSFRAPATEAFMEAARERGFPVMIGETAPRGSGIEAGNRAWERWFIPFFRFLHAHPNAKAFCYIHWYGGRTRVSADMDVLQRYRDELDEEFYQHAAPLEELRWRLEWED